MNTAPHQLPHHRHAIAFLAALASALAAVACGSSPAETTKADAAVATDTSGDAPGSDAAADTSQPATATCAAPPCGNGACDPGESPASCPDCATADADCLEKPCAAEYQACSAKPGCLNLAHCLQKCGGTTACAAACAQSQGTVGVVPVWEPLATCSAKLGCGKNCGNGTCDPRETTGNCPADCTKSVAGNGVCEPGEGPPTLCNRDCGVLVDYWACLPGACPSEWAACEGDSACKSTLACAEACGPFDNTCPEACVNAAGRNTSPYYQELVACPGKKACASTMQHLCGDGLCGVGERSVCPRDCGPPVGTCGDGVCQPKETTQKCPADCKPAAPLLACAAALCPASTAACNASPTCHSMLQCIGECPAAGWGKCADKCAVDIAKGDWWTLVEVLQCSKDFHCFPAVPPGCGDTKCTPPETETSCPQDCFEPKECGDNWCASTETKDSCPADCATCLDTGCGGKPSLVCCPVSGKPVCTSQSQCDAK